MATAYLKPLPRHLCSVPNCKTPPAFRLFNSSDVYRGTYCAKHGRFHLRQLQDLEPRTPAHRATR